MAPILKSFELKFQEKNIDMDQEAYDGNTPKGEFEIPNHKTF